MVQQEIKPTGQDSAPLSITVLNQLGESHTGGHSQDSHKIIKLATLLPNRNERVVSWITVQCQEAQWVSHHSGSGTPWIYTGKAQQEIKPTEQVPAENLQAVEALYPYRGQDPTLTLTSSRPTQAGLRSSSGNIALSTLLSQLPQEPKKGHTLIVRGQDSTSSLRISRSIQAGLRSSLGNIALPSLLSQLRQEPKKGPALIFITVYSHVVMYVVGLTLKGQNGTAILTNRATNKPRGHRPTSPLAVMFKNHLGTVSFIRSVSKLGWDLQQVLLTISKLKLIQAARGEPFLPFPREGVG